MAGENKSEKPTPRRRQKAREQGQVARSPEMGAALAMCAVLVGQVAWHWLVPVLLAALAIAMLGSVGQGGLVFAPAMLQPKLERISPAAKLKQIFSITSLVGLG